MAAIFATVTLLTSPREDVRFSRKVEDAARNFEAILLNTLIGSLEKGFSALPGDDHPAGTDSYHDFETEALSSALAARGGVGIARMITPNLMKSQRLNADATPKVSS